MGKASRDKGARAEREVVNRLKAYGFSTAQRTGEFVKNDILVHIDALERIIEVKVRAKGCGAGLLYEALGDGVFAVIHKSDRMGWLITMHLQTFCELASPARPASMDFPFARSRDDSAEISARQEAGESGNETARGGATPSARSLDAEQAREGRA